MRLLDRRYFLKKHAAHCRLQVYSSIRVQVNVPIANLKGQRNQASVWTQRSICIHGFAAKCYLKDTKSFVEHSTLTHVILHQIGASLIYGLQYNFGISSV